MNEFSINTGIQTSDFNNTINDFNKALNSFDSVKTQGSESEFEKLFNSMNQDQLSANISIDVNKNKDVSPVEKTIDDIGKGLMNSLNDLNKIQKQSETDFETFASGGDISVHDVMISAQKSNLSMQMAIQLRNRIISAYNDFKSMSV